MRKLKLTLALALAVAIVTLSVTLLGPAARQAGSPAGLRVPVVMYHHMLKEQARLGKYTISPDEFESDLKYLKEAGYESVTVAQLVSHAETGQPLPPKPVLITFDDGYESFYTYALPLLKQYGFKATLGVVGVYADSYTDNPDHNINYSHCTWEQLAEMASGGWVELANHSNDMHKNEARRGATRTKGETEQQYHEALSADLTALQDKFELHTGMRPIAYIYPFGAISDEALPLLKELGFKAALTCLEKTNYLTGSKEELYRISRYNRAHGKGVAKLIGDK